MIQQLTENDLNEKNLPHKIAQNQLKAGFGKYQMNFKSEPPHKVLYVRYVRIKLS